MGETNLAVTPAASVNIDSNAASAVTNVAADPGSGSALTIAAGDGVHGLPVLRRNRPGTKTADFSSWPEEDWTEMDSTLAVQQYIQQTIRRDVSDVEAILTAPETQDEGVWKYEHLRQFSMELNGLAVALQSECQPETCTQMTATEQWIFLVSKFSLLLIVH